MQPAPERPTLGTPSTTPMINTPPASTRRVTPSASSFTEDAVRQSLDTVKTSKSAYLGKKSVPKRTNSLQIHPMDNNSDEADREPNTSYFDHSPVPSQFLGSRGRPLSFYDMKEQQKQTRPGATPMNLRNSWRGSCEMPYNYADIIGDNRYGYAPPRLGRRRPQLCPGGPPADPTNISLGLPWTMWMNSEFKNLFVAAIGEWVGTTLFLFFAFAGTQVANAHSRTSDESTTTNATAGFSPIVMLYISVSFGFSLMVNVWIFFRISGGLFNPAVRSPPIRVVIADANHAAGYARFMGHRCCWCNTRYITVYVTNHRQYYCIRPRSRYVSYAPQRSHDAFRRDIPCTGCFY